ncbi:hypothetical protein CJ030_MR2G011929 [Morella rubra]|uniref:Uncharacterized protein n=1 Tax=Morella rubra TaxID=262757 RepID=A0A6A1WD18_9ROSI|nr:hypothetical protein CJ030_MR2G011929 [Morella rubra]
MISEGKSRVGWQAFVQMCEELISVIGVLQRKKLGPVDSAIKQGVSFAQSVRVGLPEIKVVGEKVSRQINVDNGSLKNSLRFGVLKVLHAEIGEGHVSPKNNHSVKTPAVTTGLEGRLWDHLMKLKAELDCLIRLAKNKEVDLDPRKALCHMVCGFKLVAQQPAIGPISSSSPLSFLGWICIMWAWPNSRGLGHFISGELGPSSLFVEGAVSEPTSPGLGIVEQIFADDDMGVAVLAMVSLGVSPILARSVDRVSSPEVQLWDVSYGGVSASWDWRLSVVDDEGLSTGSVQVVDLSSVDLNPSIEVIDEVGVSMGVVRSDSVGGELVALDKGDTELLIEPLRILLPS